MSGNYELVEVSRFIVKQVHKTLHMRLVNGGNNIIKHNDSISIYEMLCQSQEHTDAQGI
jgi:hypothetical protein